MNRYCCECEFWEPLPLKQQWGVCSGQDLPQHLGLSGAHVLETEDMAGCDHFEPSVDMPWEGAFGMGRDVDEYDEYCFEFLRDQGVL